MADDDVRQLMEEVREEHRLNREFHRSQVELMLDVIDRNARAFEGLTGSLDRFDLRMEAFEDKVDSLGERIDSFGERIDSFGEKVDAFGATLEIQREILLRFLDRLDEREPPRG